VVIGGNMPKVKFLQDFQGRETSEIFYKLGQVADLPDHMTAILVADRRAELVKEDDAPVFVDAIDMTMTDAPIYSEPDIFVEPQAEEDEEAPQVVEINHSEDGGKAWVNVELKPKRSKRGKK
jgi:hypothetical protein